MKRFSRVFTGLLLIGQMARTEAGAMDNLPKEDNKISSPTKNSVGIQLEVSVQYFLDDTSRSRKKSSSDSHDHGGIMMESTTRSNSPSPRSLKSKITITHDGTSAESIPETKRPLKRKITAPQSRSPSHAETMPESDSSAHPTPLKSSPRRDKTRLTRSSPDMQSELRHESKTRSHSGSSKGSPRDPHLKKAKENEIMSHNDNKEQKFDWLSLPNEENLRKEICSHIKNHEEIFSDLGLAKLKLFFESLEFLTNGRVLLRGKMEELQEDFLSLPAHYKDLITISDPNSPTDDVNSNLVKLFRLYSHRDATSKTMNASSLMKQIFSISVMRSEIGGFVNKMSEQLSAPNMKKTPPESIEGVILLQKKFLGFLSEYSGFFEIIELERTGFWEILRRFYGHTNEDIMLDTNREKLEKLIGEYETLKQMKLDEREKPAVPEKSEASTKEDESDSTLSAASNGNGERNKKSIGKYNPLSIFNHTS